KIFFCTRKDVASKCGASIACGIASARRRNAPLLTPLTALLLRFKSLAPAPLHLGRRNVLDLRRHVPAVSEWVGDHAGALAEELILRWPQHGGAGRNRSRDEAIDVVDPQLD